MTWCNRRFQARVRIGGPPVRLAQPALAVDSVDAAVSPDGLGWLPAAGDHAVRIWALPEDGANIHSAAAIRAGGRVFACAWLLERD